MKKLQRLVLKRWKQIMAGTRPCFKRSPKLLALDVKPMADESLTYKADVGIFKERLRERERCLCIACNAGGRENSHLPPSIVEALLRTCHPRLAGSAFLFNRRFTHMWRGR